MFGKAARGAFPQAGVLTIVEMREEVEGIYGTEGAQ
jgi:hypothetical protein